MQGDGPTFFLVLATLQPMAELDSFLESLVAQGRSDVELILVDQNPDERLRPLVEGFRERIRIILCGQRRVFHRLVT